ncbi:MAG: ABC transporter ATP-binding protein [Candidatus Heimdallarchaeaceae archaeon]
MKKLGIKVKNLSKVFGELKALDNVSFTINKPGLYGLIGENGAGKTTLLKTVSGLLKPTFGEIWLNSTLVSLQDLSIRNRIGFLPEDSGLYDILTAKEFLYITAGMHGIPKEERGKRVKEIVEYVGIKFPPKKIIRFLSTGQRRLLLFASVLLHDPEIVLLDESLSGLDPINRENLSHIITKLSKEKIVIFSSHILSDIWRLCTRIFILKEGKLIQDEKPEDIITRMHENTFYVVAPKEQSLSIKEFLEGKENVEILHLRGEKVVFRLQDEKELNHLVKEMISNFELKAFGPNIPDLDQIFSRLVKQK